MKPFQFQNFTIQQNKNVFRVGTDGVLLGVLCRAKNAENILEVGTGTGLISLMLAQRNTNAKILAIDINKEAVELAGENFKNSVFSDRLNVVVQDFKIFNSDKKFDAIVCNPPFFEKSKSGKDILARQQIELTFKILIEKSSDLLSEKGTLAVIIPSESSSEFENIAKKFGLHLIKKINIFGIKDGNLKRNMLEFSKENSPLEITNLIIEKSPRKYSEQYLALTKEFHVFSNSFLKRKSSD